MLKKLSLGKSAVIMLVVLLLAHLLFYVNSMAYAVVLTAVVTALFFQTKDTNFWCAWAIAGVFGLIFGILYMILSDGRITFYVSFLMVTAWSYVFTASICFWLNADEKKETPKQHEENTTTA